MELASLAKLELSSTQPLKLVKTFAVLINSLMEQIVFVNKDF